MLQDKGEEDTGDCDTAGAGFPSETDSGFTPKADADEGAGEAERRARLCLVGELASGDRPTLS